MLIEEPLRHGKFLKRYKRFFADVKIGDVTLVAHVPNTGSLKTCLFEGSDCIVSESSNPARKLKATLHFVKTPMGWAGVNTSLPNALVHEAWTEGRLPEWRKFQLLKREFKISRETRIDMVLANDDAHFAIGKGLHFVEIKNVTLNEGATARFPDAVTERGQKHLLELMRLKAEGHSAELVFVVQREGCASFAPADAIDPEYGRLLRQAYTAGVKISAYPCHFNPSQGITLIPSPLPITL